MIGRSPTDVDRADNPLLAGWHFVIVSLRQAEPVLRSYVIDGRAVVQTNEYSLQLWDDYMKETE